MFACQEDPSSHNEPDGLALSKIYCASCHDYPSPTLLNRATWDDYVLPRMGHMLGIYKDEGERATLIKGMPPGATPYYPENPIIDSAKWQSIQNYYLTNSPDTLNIPSKTILRGSLKQFEVKVPQIQFSPPSTTLLKMGKNGHTYLGDAHTQSFVDLDQNMKIANLAKVNEGAVNLHETDDNFIVTVMGSFSPADSTGGMVIELPKDNKKQLRILIKDLRRPVHSSFADLDNDGNVDIIVSEFGKWAGRLNIFYGAQSGNYHQQVLLNQTGATKTLTVDYNNDGLIDVVSLFAQGQEGIYLHSNLGKRQFKTQRIVELSPSHGSSFFDLYDMDDDGDLDIIYTAGDNADFPALLRPYHGIYIFENDGLFNFKQSFFQHLNGAYAAIPRDFDLDGDIDIAAISFFPDYDNLPQESFVYLHNTGDDKYEIQTFEMPEMGRWIIMDAHDRDSDGDIDLVLGSLAFEAINKGALVQKWVEQGIPFVYLENQHR